MNRRHWQSIGLQLGILCIMGGLSFLSTDLYLLVVTIALIVFPAVNWAVAGVLVWTSHHDPTIRSLADAADNQINLAISSSVAAAVAGMVLARLLGLLVIPIGDILTVLLGFAVVSISIPAFRFLQTWRDVWMPIVRQHRQDESDRIDLEGGSS